MTARVQKVDRGMLRALALGTAVFIVLWAAVNFAVEQAEFAVYAPKARVAKEVLAAFASFFGALVLFVLPTEEAVSRRLRWVACGLLVLGLGTLAFGYLEPLLEGGTYDHNESMYRALITRTFAGVLFTVGLLPKTPPRFSGRMMLAVLAAFVALAVAVEVAGGTLPRLFLVPSLEAAAELDAYPLGRLTVWHWVLSAVPLAIAAAVGVGRRDFGGTLGIWLTLAMVLLAGFQVHHLLWPSAYGPVLTSADLLRLAVTVVIAVGGVLELRRITAERSALLAGERETKASYRTLVEQVPAVVYVDGVDDANAAIFRSAHVEEVLGHAPEEFSSDPEFWQKLLHPDDKERVLAENERTNQTGEPFRIECRLIHRDGRVVWVRNEAILIRDEAGEPLYWHGVSGAPPSGRRPARSPAS